jgi:hypothetical protein
MNANDDHDNHDHKTNDSPRYRFQLLLLRYPVIDYEFAGKAQPIQARATIRLASGPVEILGVYRPNIEWYFVIFVFLPRIHEKRSCRLSSAAGFDPARERSPLPGE